MTRLIIVFLFISLRLASQSDTLNKTNANGKKHGYWLQYLDKYLNAIDSAHHIYTGYELYDNGKALYKFKNFKWRHTHILVLKPDSTYTEKLVSGSFIWLNPKTNKVIGEEIYFRGHPVSIQEHFYVSHGQPKDSVKCNITYLIDYSKRFENQRGSYYGAQYNRPIKPGDSLQISEYWYANIDGKWKFRKIANNYYC
jgi:hypothetical protein